MQIPEELDFADSLDQIPVKNNAHLMISSEALEVEEDVSVMPTKSLVTKASTAVVNEENTVWDKTTKFNPGVIFDR